MSSVRDEALLIYDFQWHSHQFSIEASQHADSFLQRHHTPDIYKKGKVGRLKQIKAR